jgi:hypothetical protein
MKRMPAVDKPFKRTFEISFQEKMQVSKIALYKQEGTLKDPADPLWKILGDRSVAYGKGLGGGGGKYIPGIRKQAPVNNKIVSVLNLSTLSEKQ